MPAEKKATYVSMPPRIHRAAQACADSIGQSLSAFIVQAVAQRIRNWRDPITGEKVVVEQLEGDEEAKWQGWECTHGSHGEAIPAMECESREESAHQKQMVNWETGEEGWRE